MPASIRHRYGGSARRGPESSGCLERAAEPDQEDRDHAGLALQVRQLERARLRRVCLLRNFLGGSSTTTNCRKARACYQLLRDRGKLKTGSREGAFRIHYLDFAIQERMPKPSGEATVKRLHETCWRKVHR
jgi:hypothetical protein